MPQVRSPRHLAYGRVIRALRSERALSQERLAELADLDRTYVSGIERGERNPSLANLLKIADALGSPLSEIARRAETETH
jgi:transcriptional regulator with XRE-family HTH domain